VRGIQRAAEAAPEVRHNLAQRVSAGSCDEPKRSAVGAAHLSLSRNANAMYNRCEIPERLANRGIVLVWAAVALCLVACGGRPGGLSPDDKPAASGSQTLLVPPAPPAASTGGFDGARAFEHVRHLVELGSRPPGSPAIREAQAYIAGQLKSFGCAVEEHAFHASTPIGDFLMKNIVAKIPGTAPGIVLLATHYDTVRMPNFVGADDGGSGTGTILELARVLCPRKGKLNIWITFFDGEEAQGNWTDRNSIQWTATNNTYGSREMAASMALSGELPRVKAMILSDMIGPSDLKIKRDINPRGEQASTPWLVDLVWATAARLGYGNVFVNEDYPVGGDDHFSFIKRGVAAIDIIDFDVQYTYWHTPQDTLDKVDPRSLAVVGHVLLETVPELEMQFP
jgi:glutaminyl-peptide cyclotransferase